MVLIEETALVKVRDLKKWFPVRKGIFSRSLTAYVKAVDKISFDIRDKEIVGLAGESGCGKTTTGRLLLRLIEPQGGKVYFNKVDVFSLNKKELRDLRRKMQIIFQDPYKSLPPRMKVFDAIAEPLSLHHITKNKVESIEIVTRVLESVQLTPLEMFLNRYPNELSGGQRQRVALARALVVQPKFLVADEPVSMLDVSIRAGMMNLMLELKEKYGLTCLFITHDLSVARYMCDRVIIMYLGKILEEGPIEKVIGEPIHPYTQALVSAVPIPDPEVKYHLEVIQTEVPSAINPPLGCRFYPRCRYAKPVCKREEPEMIKADKNQYVACHLLK